ncbi:MAG: pirin family protein [Rubrivivax sp.]|nr:pirin family protein [Rubrivivax sp.]
MITLRKAGERGHANHGWLDSWHSFSFAEYHDPAHMGVGNLRVINEDRIAPGSGFGTHGHRDMEIVSYVLDGALAHQDSMGNGGPGGVIRPGDVQRMSAGSGVMHSEFNHSREQVTHFLQIWILPRHRGIEPGYEQRHFDAAAKRGRLALVASPDGAQGSLTIHADARLHAGLFDGDESAAVEIDPARPTYVHLARGSLRVNGQALEAGDALTLRGETRLQLDQGRGAEVLVFELAAH